MLRFFPNVINSNSVGACVAFIFSMLLKRKSEFKNRFIYLNRVDDKAREVLQKSGGNFYYNIQYELPANIEEVDVLSQATLYAEIIQLALLQISKKYKLQLENLVKAIKSEVVDKKFEFEFNSRLVKNRWDKSLNAYISVRPQFKEFKFFANIMKNEKLVCRTEIYSGATTDYYLDILFGIQKWQTRDCFHVTGEESDVIFELNINDCRFSVLPKAGTSGLSHSIAYKSSTTQEEKDKFYNNLPPHLQSVLRTYEN